MSSISSPADGALEFGVGPVVIAEGLQDTDKVLSHQAALADAVVAGRHGMPAVHGKSVPFGGGFKASDLGWTAFLLVLLMLAVPVTAHEPDAKTCKTANETFMENGSVCRKADADEFLEDDGEEDVWNFRNKTCKVCFHIWYLLQGVVIGLLVENNIRLRRKLNKFKGKDK